MRTPATPSVLLFIFTLTTPEAFASDDVRPENLSSVRIEVPIATDDFSHLEDPAGELRDALENALVQSGVPREMANAKDEKGHYLKTPTGPRFIPSIQSQIERTVRDTLAHDGYAGRIWVHDMTKGTLTKVIVALYPSENPAFSAVVRAHESGHSATHARAVDTAKHNATLSGSPGKKADRWKQDIEKHEDDGAKEFHERVGRTTLENLQNLGCHAEDPAAFEGIGTEAADATLGRLEPFSPPGPRR
ncbi:MAG: hypothetical protein HY720_07990 [Planctomycetes bacterium]|nr:hypothetical protein [Planctomycetota bacterium]